MSPKVLDHVPIKPHVPRWPLPCPQGPVKSIVPMRSPPGPQGIPCPRVASAMSPVAQGTPSTSCPQMASALSPVAQGTYPAPCPHMDTTTTPRSPLSPGGLYCALIKFHVPMQPLPCPQRIYQVPCSLVDSTMSPRSPMSPYGLCRVPKGPSTSLSPCELYHVVINPHVPTRPLLCPQDLR